MIKQSNHRLVGIRIGVIMFRWIYVILVGRVDAVVVVVEASAPKVYPRVTLASAGTLSGSVVRALRGGEGLPKMKVKIGIPSN